LIVGRGENCGKTKTEGIGRRGHMLPVPHSEK
jgi:hypothetical protein